MSAISDLDGNYTVKLTPGHYVVAFDHPDYEPATVEADIVYNQTTTLNVKLKKKKGTLTGQVTDEETNVAIANVTVTAAKQ